MITAVTAMMYVAHILAHGSNSKQSEQYIQWMDVESNGQTEMDVQTNKWKWDQKNGCVGSKEWMCTKYNNTYTEYIL